MIYLRIVRQAVCEECGETWELDPTGASPIDCPFCKSQCWNGKADRPSVWARHGRTRKKKRLNPGAKSKKRQERAKKQWRQFKPKPVEESAKPAEN